MTQQLTFDGLPEDDGPPDSGWLYFCINAYGLLKPGMSATWLGKVRRVKSHAMKANMREVMAHRVPNIVDLENAIKAIMRPYRRTGAEWFDISDVAGVSEVVEHLEREAPDMNMWPLRVAISEHVRADPRFHATTPRDETA